MELMLNELSIKPYSFDKYKANSKVIEFVLTMKKAKENGFEKIRANHSVSEIILADNYSLYNWLTDKDFSKDCKDYRDFLFGTIVRPFINEDDKEIEDAYISANFYYLQGIDTKLDCLGLTAAYLYDLPSISFNSSEEWQKTQLSIYIEKEDNITENKVFNVFSNNCFLTPEISQYIEGLGDVVLLKSELNPNEKKIHLADHHGKEYLRQLANKLVNSPYVVEIKSTNFGGNSFIRKIHPNGVLEIVDLKRDERFALQVQTTGRNYRETEAIANEIK